MSAQSVSASVRSQFGLALWRTRLSLPNAQDRLNALRAIERYAPRACAEDPECIAQLEERFSTEADGSVQRALVDCYAHVAGPRATHMLVVSAVNRTTLAPSVGAHALALVGRNLSGDDFDSIVAATTASGWTQHQMLFNAAMDALSHAPDDVFADRVNAHRSTSGRVAVLLSAIATRGDPRWGAVVIEQLNGDIAVRAAACNAAASLRLLEAATPLSRMVMSAGNPLEVRVAALRALGVVGAGDPTQTQLALSAGLRDVRSRDAAQLAAARLGMQSLVGEIASGLRATWNVDRRNTAEILGDLGGAAAARAMIAALSSEQDANVRRALWRATVRADENEAETALRSVREPDDAARWGAVELGLVSGRWVSLGASSAQRNTAVSVLTLDCALGRTADTFTALRDESVQQRTNAAWALTFAPPSAAVEQVVLRQLSTERVAIVRALLWISAAHNDSLAVRQRLAENFVGTPGVLTPDVLVALDVASRLGVQIPSGWAVALLEDHRPSVRALGAWVVRRLSLRLAVPLLLRVAQSESHVEARRAEFAALGQSEVDSVEAGQWSARSVQYGGESTVRVDGTTPNTLWTVWLPGGSMALALANGEGMIMVSKVSTGPMALDCVE